MACPPASSCAVAIRTQLRRHVAMAVQWRRSCQNVMVAVLMVAVLSGEGRSRLHGCWGRSRLPEDQDNISLAQRVCTVCCAASERGIMFQSSRV